MDKVAHSAKAMFQDGVYVLRPAFESSLDDASAAAAAAIPVEKIAGPLMLISGTDDQVWPSVPTRTSSSSGGRLQAFPMPTRT